MVSDLERAVEVVLLRGSLEEHAAALLVRPEDHIARVAEVTSAQCDFFIVPVEGMVKLGHDGRRRALVLDVGHRLVEDGVQTPASFVDLPRRINVLQVANELLRHDAAADALFVPPADAIKHADQAFVFADEERVLTLLISLVEVWVERRC